MKVSNERKMALRREFWNDESDNEDVSEEQYDHSVIDVPVLGVGSRMRAKCKCYSQLQWSIKFNELQGHDHVRSPIFKFGKQRYLLELCNSSSIDMYIHRLGPSVDGLFRFVQCWIGLQLDHNIYHHNVIRHEICLIKKYESWRGVVAIYPLFEPDMKRWLQAQDRRLTIFVLMIKKELRREMEPFVYTNTMFPVRGDGDIRKEERLCHVQVEWEINYEAFREYGYLWSPSFKIGDQYYLLDFRGSFLRLFRMGPSVDGPARSVRCWAGMKLGDGNYHHKIERFQFFLVKACELWSEEGLLYITFHSDLERQQHLILDGHLTFFVRMKQGRISTGQETCTHKCTDMSARSVGNIAEEEWTFFKRVKWCVEYEPTSVPVISPVFAAGNQSCFLMLSPETVYLYWMGPCVNKSMRWWVNVKSGGETNHHYNCGCGEIDLKEEVYEMWTYQYLLPFEQDGKVRLTIDFLLSLKRDPYAMEPCARADDQAVQDVKPLLGEYVTFQVKDKKFKIHKNILSIRVPAFEAMFLHDCIESRTSVVSIEDCEPEIFQMFLNFIYYGKPLIMTIDFAFDLYVVADKYLVDELKACCLRNIKCNLSVDTFVDVLVIALRYGEDDLLQRAICFFSQNESIRETETWQDFCIQNPREANTFLTKVFSLQN